MHICVHIELHVQYSSIVYTMLLHVISSQLLTDVQDLMIYTSAKASDVASSLADNANNSPTFLTEVNNRVAYTVFLHRIHQCFCM